MMIIGWALFNGSRGGGSGFSDGVLLRRLEIPNLLMICPALSCTAEMVSVLESADHFGFIGDVASTTDLFVNLCPTLLLVKQRIKDCPDEKCGVLPRSHRQNRPWLLLNAGFTATIFCLGR